MLPVVIATPRVDCPAWLALRIEGIAAYVEVVDEPHAYGQLLHRMWGEGGFILVEHDIAPWPGAVAQLDACDRDVCAFPYRRHVTADGSTAWGVSLGCIKFADAYVRDHPLEHRIAWTDWRLVDTVFWSEHDVAGVHVHEPGVAHCRA